MSDLILHYGFQTIFSNIKYNNDKSLNLLKNGHVINVQEVKTIMGSCFISGQVIRQASVTSPFYRVKIEVNSTIYFFTFIIFYYSILCVTYEISNTRYIFKKY